MTSVEAYEEGRTFTEFLEAAEASRDLWLAVTGRAALH